jgi:CRISPR-associated endonuclease/helicase Cas3
MLSADAIAPAPKPNDPPLLSLDVADHPGYEQRDDATPRLRVIIRRTDEGVWAPESLAGGVNISDRLDLEESYDSSPALFAALRKSGLRIRLVQPVDFNDEGDAVRSLVMLAPVADQTKPEDQSLVDHVGAVEKEAKGIAGKLELKDPFRAALLFAARWHDEGKKADVWQRFVYGPDESGAYKGKSSNMRDPKSLRGYRHEFGSLLRLHHPGRHDTPCTLPTDADTHDLALHLIATHHGFGRPHFDTAMDRDFSTTDCDTVHTESIRRFARLQRKHGWWHLAWLENLLRCADGLASADAESEDDPADPDGEAS